jgi:DNA-binding transcriptional ArsR family regulator
MNGPDRPDRPVEVPDDARLHKALSHPLRQRILGLLQGCDGDGVSPSQMSESLREPLGVVSYHVQRLVDLDVLELTRTEPVRGVVEHFYRPMVVVAPLEWEVVAWVDDKSDRTDGARA